MALGFDDIFDRIDKIQSKSSEASVLVASQLLADIKTRVFQDGKDTAGSELKNIRRKEPGTGYSKRSYFTSLSSLINKSRAPNASKGGFIQLPEGYTSFREFSGRQTQKIDLDYTSVLRQGFIFKLNQQGFELGFVGSSGSSSSATVIEKAEFAEYRNGSPVFNASDDEIKDAVQTYVEYVSE